MEFRKDHPSVKLHQAPGGSSTFSLGWDDGSAYRVPQQQPQVYQNSPWATHEDQPQVQSQPRRQVQESPFATSTQEQSYQPQPRGRKQFNVPSQDQPWATHDQQENVYEQKSQKYQVSQAPYAQYGAVEEYKENTTSVKVQRAPGGGSQFQLSDGSYTTDSERFKTSNQKANQHVDTKIMQAVTGKLSQAAGKKPLGVQNGTTQHSQITF